MARIIIALLAVFAAAPTPAVAQNWDWQLTPYLWAAGIDGDVAVGPVDASVSMDFEDIVNVLRGGALLRLEGQTDRHGVFADLVYLRLKEKNARDTIGGSLEVKMDTLIVEGAYYYRWNEAFGLEVGARYWDFETTLRPAILQERVGSSDWIDGFIGIRTDRDINQNWSWLFRGNVGGGGADFAAGLQLDFRRKYSSGNALALGLRILEVDHSSTSGGVPMNLDMSFSGLTVGYTFGL